MIPPTINEPIMVSIPDNQILLSFNGDSDAIEFYKWFTNKGYELFKIYCLKKENEMIKDY